MRNANNLCSSNNKAKLNIENAINTSHFLIKMMHFVDSRKANVIYKKHHRKLRHIIQCSSILLTITFDKRFYITINYVMLSRLLL